MCGSANHRILGKRLNGHQGLRPRSASGISVSVERCLDCGLIYPNPMPVPDDLGQHYDVDPSAYWKDARFELDGYFEGQISTFRELWAGDDPSALDIGAGLGRCMAALARAGFDATGIEPSPSFHAAAIENGVAPTRLLLAPVEEAEFARGFDFVTFGAVLEHLRDPAAAIERAIRWTAPGGLIHIEVPSARWLTAQLAWWAYRLQGLDYVPFLSPMHPPYHLYEFTLDAFERLGERLGYTVCRHQIHVAETFLPGIVSRLGAAVMSRTGTGMQLEVWLEPHVRDPRAADTVS